MKTVTAPRTMFMFSTDGKKHGTKTPLILHTLSSSCSFGCNYFQVMREYNEGLLTKQERCKHFIIRQLEVSGKPVTEEEVDEMVATGNWEVFNENLLNDVRITRTQLSEIEQRHKVREAQVTHWTNTKVTIDS